MTHPPDQCALSCIPPGAFAKFMIEDRYLRCPRCEEEFYTRPMARDQDRRLRTEIMKEEE